MNTSTRFSHLSLIALLTLLLVQALPGMGSLPDSQSTALPDGKILLSSSSARANLQAARSYPLDPSADISWSAGTATVADIQSAFNNARAAESNQLGISLPMMTLPDQTSWNKMTHGEKALWLINRERIDRGVMPLQGVENNVSGVAQNYANYLLGNNAWGHTADGRDPWKRLSANQAIGACYDFLPIAENLAVFVTSGSSIPLPIERSIYMWLYDDGNCCGWGHRHAMLWQRYNDNSGSSGREGFLGIGRASGGPYRGGFSQSWPFAEIIVMNVFDPCAGWVDRYAPGAASPTAPSGTVASTTPTFSWKMPGDTDVTDPATWYYVWVNGPSGTVIKQWYSSAEASCNGSTCSVTSPKSLTGGAHTWWIQTWNNTGYGPWSTGMSFNVSAPTSTPEKAILASPGGNEAGANPAYTWNETSGTTWYYLWVNGPSGNVIKQWYSSAGANCNGTTCSVTPAKALGPGSHTWWVQTYNSAGYGPWSGGMSFSVPAPVLPGKATLVSPGGSNGSSTPTYTWNQVSAATWYYLWVNGPSGNVVKQWYTSAQANCNGSTCSVSPATTLSGGAHSWWIQTYGSSGYGPWSEGMNFTTPP